MPDCSDSNLGKLLHAYELGSLSEEETELFEIHLLECEHCFAEFSGFRKEVSQLFNDNNIRDAARSVSGSQDTATESPFHTFLQRLWPQVPFFFKPAVAYLIALLIVLPSLYVANQPGNNEIKCAQRIALADSRSSDGNSFNVYPAARDIIIAFRYTDAVEGEVYLVTLEREDNGSVLYSRPYGIFDDADMGHISLAPSVLKQGRYKLTITDPDSESPSDTQIYYFNITK